MDQSRPGHQALPLIIERPDLAHPFRRAFSIILTAGGWIVWLIMWIPFLGALARHFGYNVPLVSFPSQLSLHSFLLLAELIPIVVIAAMLAMALRFLWEKLRNHAGFPDRRWRPVGLERLAHHMALDPERLAGWQSAQILYVRHGDRGNVLDATTNQPKRPE